MNELALAAFAASTDAHVVDVPRTARFAAFADRFDAAAYRNALEERGLRWIARSDPLFPPLLRSIHDPPPGLFLRGALRPRALAEAAVAVVGARSASAYGAAVARMLGRELGAAGITVVSGLARGIDAAAHRGALEAGGVTVGVLGCGIDRDYPAAHAELAGSICERGAVLAEYAPGVEPAPWRFPARNRIIAGLSLATIVVEARERSGALITADFALEEGREVFAVPGEITNALSAGANALLKLGASPLTKVEDVLDALGYERAKDAPPELSPAAGTVLDVLREAAASADELVRTTTLYPGVLAAALAELELAGLASEGGGVYRAT